MLHIIGEIGTAGATGYVVEYAGSAIRALSMEGRMTICNMSIEAGARAGMIAPDATTFAYLKGRTCSPAGFAWDQAVAHWSQLVTDEGAIFDRELTLDAAAITPTVSWGTSPGMVTGVKSTVPLPDPNASEADRKNFERALEYMDLKPGTPIEEIKIDAVFLGSCTNARIEDLRAAASIVRGHHIATTVRAMVVPGSQAVKRQAEEEGLDAIFKSAGFEWREPGCSMCLGMNPDILSPGERCASTSNRNFEGRQGRGGRTHLVIPADGRRRRDHRPLHRHPQLGVQAMIETPRITKTAEQKVAFIHVVVPRAEIRSAMDSGTAELTRSSRRRTSRPPVLGLRTICSAPSRPSTSSCAFPSTRRSRPPAASSTAPSPPAPSPRPSTTAATTACPAPGASSTSGSTRTAMSPPPTCSRPTSSTPIPARTPADWRTRLERPLLI